MEGHSLLGMTQQEGVHDEVHVAEQTGVLELISYACHSREHCGLCCLPHPIPVSILVASMEDCPIARNLG